MSLFFLGANFAWLRLDHSPPSWDDAYYLSNSLVLYDTLADHGAGAYARKLLTVMGNKPPLIAALPTPVYLVFGRKPRAALLVNLGWLFVILAAVYWLGKRYAGPRAGLLAAFVAGTMPMIYGLSRWFLVECGLTAIVCVAVCLLAEWNKSTGMLKAVLLGAACGLGLLMKASFPLYIAIPALVFVWRMRLRSVLVVAATAAVIAGPWYLVNWRAAFQTAVQAGSASTAKVYGTGAVFSFADIRGYLINLANTAPALYVVALAILAVVFYRRLRPEARRGLIVCALWLAPVLFLIFGHYRDLRYAAPLVPAVAVALGLLLDTALRMRPAITGAITAVLLALPLTSMLQTSFGARPMELGGLLFVPPRFDYARAFRSAEWPQRAILADLHRASTFSGGETKHVLLGTDSVGFNADNFRLAALEDRRPFDIGTTSYETDAAALAARVDGAAFFIYKDGGEPEAPSFNALGQAAGERARNSGRFVELQIGRTLPDGGVVHVFANRFPGRLEQSSVFLPAGLDEVAPAKVIFADKLELTGLSMERTSDGLVVKYRWRCLKPVDRDYWCFTHILDAGGNIAGYLDHQILSGGPPTGSWKISDTGIERLLFRVPPNDATYRLRLGVFDRASGDRLAITASDFPLSDGATAALFVPNRESR